MTEVVKEQAPTQPAGSETLQTQEPAAVVTATQATQPGEKTDPALLLKSLQEEREKRKRAEEALKVLESNQVPSDTEVYSDEGKAIVDKFVKPLEREIQTLREQSELKDVYATYPDLKGLSSEFDEYRKDYPRHKLGNIAKLFLNEKGLLESPRKGLEKTTGGPRTPVQTGMTAEDVKNLRTNNPRKYEDMLRKGLIDIKG